MGVVWAQPLLPLTRLVYYSSGKAYWVREAMIPLSRSPVVVRLPGKAEPLMLLPQPEYRVRHWSFSPDTLQVEGKSEANNLLEFLRRHVGSIVWLSYAVGNEWEEVQGIIEQVSSGGDVLIRRPSQERLWLPRRWLRAARIDSGASPREIVPAWRLLIDADTTLATARVAVSGWDSLLPWRAIHTLQLISPTRAALTTQIKIPPLIETAPSVELFLIQNESDSTRLATWHLAMQKLPSHAENRLILLRAEMPYTDLYRASPPDLVESLDPLTLTTWRGFAERSLQLLNTTQTTLPAGIAYIFDEQGLPIAQSNLSITVPAATGYIPLARTSEIELRLQEQEVRRERLKESAGTTKVVITGILRLQNSTPREARLLIQKPITGQPVMDKLGFARAFPMPERRGPNPRFLLQWEIILRPGGTENLEYAYELLLPHLK